MKREKIKPPALSIPEVMNSVKATTAFSNISADSFFKAFKSSPVASALISIEDNSYLQVNRKFLELFESTKKKMLGSNPDKLGLWPGPEEREKVLKEYRRRKGSGTINFSIKTAKGRIRNILSNSETIEIDNRKYLLGQMLDVTESKLSEERIKESERIFRGLIENSRDVIYRYELKKWEYEYVSPSSKVILGIDSKTFIEKKFGILYSILHKDEKKKFRDHFSKVFYDKGKGKKSFTIEYRIKTGSKSYKFIADNHTIVYDKTGAPAALIGNISDITRIKTTEQELGRSFEKQREYLNTLTTIQNAIPAHIALLDRSGMIIAVNESWRNTAENNRLLNSKYCPGTNYLKTCERSTGRNSEEARLAAKGIRKILRNEIGEYQLEYPSHAKQEKHWFRLVVTPVSREKNEGAVVMHINITDKMLAELALKESEKQYKALFKEDLSGNFVSDPSGRILLCNPSFARMFGFGNPDEATNAGRTILFNRDTESRKVLHSLKEGGKIHLHERALKLADGRTMTVLENLTGKYDIDGRLMNIQGFVIDISGVKKAERALKRRSEEQNILFETSKKLSASLDIKEVYKRIYRTVSRLMPCSGMGISSFDSIKKTIKLQSIWAEGKSRKVADIPEFRYDPRGKGVQSRVIKSRRSLFISDFETYSKKMRNVVHVGSDNKVHTKEINRDTLARQSILSPLISENRVIGVIQVQSAEKNAYTGDHIRLLEALAAQASSALMNARLYDKAQTEIAERKKKEEELKRTRGNMEEAQRIAHLGNWVYDIASDVLYNSEEINRILGIASSEKSMEFSKGMQHIHDEDREISLGNIKTAIEKRTSYVNEDRIVRPGGEVRYVKVMGEPVFNRKGELNGMQGTMQDITDVKRINDELMRSLNEKEMMLKEIHHRVKNNLQIVSSLLRLQSEKITDKTAVDYFKLSEQRVKSMALIHQQLYRARDLSRINFREYLRELCTYLFFVNGISSSRIRLQLDADDIHYGIDIALPCGLIVNELVTNSLKHAFPGERKGTITVLLKKDTAGNNILAVSDNGTGSPGLDLKNTKTLGLELVNTLTEQIEGKIEFCSEDGMTARIVFADPEPVKKVAK